MIVKAAKRGRSFTKLAAYLTSNREGQHRALWSSVENVEATNPKTAAKIMAFVERHADEIKQAAGVKATGKKVTTPPLYHVVMSWADGEKPDQAHQLEAARDMLKAIGLDKAQAVIVAHNDNGREHLHIMANLVDPETGKRFSLSNDQHKMQEWALAYERKQGAVLIERREKNAEKWAKGEPKEKAEAIPRAAMDKAAKSQRRAWAEVKAERDALFSGQSAERAAMRAEHGEQWKRAKAEAAAHKAAYKAAFRAAYGKAKAVAKIENKPVWRDVFRIQKAERASIERAALDARKNAEAARRHAAKATAAAQKAERRSRSLVGRIGQRLGFVQGPEVAQQRQQRAAELMQAAALRLAQVELQKAQLSAKQEADRRAVAKQISADTFAKAQLAVDTMPRADFAAMIQRQDEQRRAMIERHNAAREALGLKPYEPRKQGAAPMGEYKLNPERENYARDRFNTARHAEQAERAEGPKVQGASPQFTPAGQRTGTTPAAPTREAVEQAERAREAASKTQEQRTAFSGRDLQGAEAAKAQATEQSAERKASPLDKARERNNTPEAKAERLSQREAQKAFDRSRKRDDFQR